MQLLANQFNMDFCRRKRIVTHPGTGPGVCKRAVAGDLAVIPIAPAGSKMFAGRDHRIKFFGWNAEILKRVNFM